MEIIMREIKFRAWDKNRKCFHYWGLAIHLNGAYFEGPPLRWPDPLPVYGPSG
jgi:hypothetical protein